MAQPKSSEPVKQTLRRTVRITNPQGLHMRPAAAFAELASQFASDVTVTRGGQNVDGKNWVELLLLAAEPGADLTLVVSGTDANRALEALAAKLATPTVEPNEPAKPPSAADS